MQLIPLSTNDVETTLQIRNQPSVRQWSRSSDPISYSEHYDWLFRLNKNNRAYKIMIDYKDSSYSEIKICIGVISLTGINYISRSAQLNIYLSEDFQKMGYGPDAMDLLLKIAFDQLNLNRVWLEFLDGCNIANVIERRFFIHEGRLRQSCFKDGEYVDSHICSLLRSDYYR